MSQLVLPTQQCLPCRAVPCCAALAQDSTGSSSKQGPPAIHDPLKAHPWWCSPREQGQESHSCLLQNTVSHAHLGCHWSSHHLRNPWPHFTGGESEAWSREVISSGSSPEIGRRTHPFNQCVAGKEGASPSTQLKISAGGSCPLSLFFPSQWESSAQPQLCIPLPNPSPPTGRPVRSEEMSTRGWRPHGWRELNN